MYLRGDPNDYFDGKASIPEIHGINQNISCDKPNIYIYIYMLHPPKNGDLNRCGWEPGDEFAEMVLEGKRHGQELQEDVELDALPTVPVAQL